MRSIISLVRCFTTARQSTSAYHKTSRRGVLINLRPFSRLGSLILQTLHPSHNCFDLIGNIPALQRNLTTFTFLVQINGSRGMLCNHPNAYRLVSNQPQKQFPPAHFNICTSAADICGSNHSLPFANSLSLHPAQYQEQHGPYCRCIFCQT